MQKGHAVKQHSTVPWCLQGHVAGLGTAILGSAVLPESHRLPQGEEEAQHVDGAPWGQWLNVLEGLGGLQEGCVGVYQLLGTVQKMFSGKDI